MKFYKVIQSIVLLFFAITSSCSTPHCIILNCEDPTIDIFVDEEYIGRGNVRYVFPKGKNTIEITCSENGQELYRRTIYKDACSTNEILDIVPQRNLNYSL